MTDQTHPGVRDDASPESVVLPQSRTESDLIDLHEPEAEQPTARKKIRPLWIVTAVLIAVVIALGLTLGPTAWRMYSQSGATLATPEKIGTFTRDDSEAAKQAAGDLIIALQATGEFDAAVGAVYQDPTGLPANSVLFFGGTVFLPNPADRLNAVIEVMSDSTDNSDDFQSVDPGPLGGIMRCGSESEYGMICMWADHGSVAVGMFPSLGAQQAADLMRQFRAATLTR